MVLQRDRSKHLLNPLSCRASGHHKGPSSDCAPRPGYQLLEHPLPVCAPLSGVAMLMAWHQWQLKLLRSSAMHCTHFTTSVAPGLPSCQNHPLPASLARSGATLARGGRSQARAHMMVWRHQAPHQRQLTPSRLPVSGRRHARRHARRHRLARAPREPPKSLSTHCQRASATFFAARCSRAREHVDDVQPDAAGRVDHRAQVAAHLVPAWQRYAAVHLWTAI